MNDTRIGYSRNMARKILNKLSITKLPIPLKPVLESAKITIKYSQSMKKKCSGIIFPTTRLISINAYHHIYRQRFTIAHELGHFFLNHEGGKFIDNTGFEGSYGSGIIEKDEELKVADREANEFAAELLIPLALLKENYKKLKSPKALAELFNISETALWVSLIKHNMIK